MKNMQFDKSLLFFCYDRALHIELKEQNISYITTAISNSNKRFWLYWRDDKVNQILKQRSVC